MQDDPRYDDVVPSDVKAFLEERMAFRGGRGVREERMQLDPGISFGKRSSATSSCCAGSTSWSQSSRPLVVGTSRKSFLGRLTGRDMTERIGRTVATNLLSVDAGASISSACATSPPPRHARGDGCYIGRR